MGTLFLVLIIKFVGWALRAILFSFRIAWWIIKAEFAWAAFCFRKYPIGFISFFFHFVGYIAAAMFSIVGERLWLKLYTFGIFDNKNDLMLFAGAPVKIIKFVTELIGNSGDNIFLALCGVLLLYLVVVPVCLLVVELYLFFFPAFTSDDNSNTIEYTVEGLCTTMEKKKNLRERL